MGCPWNPTDGSHAVQDCRLAETSAKTREGLPGSEPLEGSLPSRFLTWRCHGVRCLLDVSMPLLHRQFHRIAHEVPVIIKCAKAKHHLGCLRSCHASRSEATPSTIFPDEEDRQGDRDSPIDCGSGCKLCKASSPCALGHGMPR